jgi:hypothetical protein
MGIASLIKEMRGKSASIISFTHCINETVLSSGNNDDYIREEVRNSLERQTKINVERRHGIVLN